MRRVHHSLSNPFSFIKAASKQIRHIIQHKTKWLKARNAAKIKYIYFYPEFPHPYTVVYRIFHKLGIAMKKGLPKIGEKALCLWWEDSTFVEPGISNTFINARCLDISKHKVDQIHQLVFQYALAIDPFTYDGTMVIKSNLNGEHDGKEVEGPIRNDQFIQDCVYQRVVNNRSKEDPTLICDIRVAIFDSKPGFCYLKYRPISARFSNKNTTVQLAELSSILRADELKNIHLFCQKIGLDYGEIDVVRDNDDKRIYILDVNKTPLGPPNGLSPKDHLTAIDLYATAFSQWLYELG